MGRRDRLREELARAKERRAVLEKKIEALEKDLRETENAEILGLVRSYDLTPEELAKLMSRLAGKQAGSEKEESNQ